MSLLKEIKEITDALNKGDERWLCNELFGESGKKHKKDFCKICKMALPKSGTFIDYTGQVRHILNNHNVEEIANFLKIETLKEPETINICFDIIEYDEKRHARIIKERLKEFKDKTIRITVEDIKGGIR